MAISKKFQPREIEEKWYSHWMEKGYFHSVPDNREPYTIVIPPPNVTGVLHMGHMLNNTLQDVLIRRARLLGYNACWVPGTDHASIATEAKVVAKLKEEGIEKSDLTRGEFIQHAWDWTEKHGGIILEQLKKLGASCDWERTAFTMDDTRSDSVIKVFTDLYKKGKIYRGFRMVNWDPDAQTTVSDEEVIHKEIQTKLYYIRYQIEGGEGDITIATVRPETILGDTAVCINPNDDRFRHLKGKKVIIPIAERAIPVIEDEYVDMEFGTGCLKITPAHDPNDKEIGERHNLQIIDILNDDGTLNQHGLHYEGMDRFKSRKEIAKELKEKGFLVKTEDYTTNVGTSERTGSVIEPKISIQWFLKMKEISEPALNSVLDEEVKLIPGKFIKTYKYWMENVRDWCISRQLYWGHQIPAWHYGEGINDYVVADTQQEALELAAKEKPGIGINDLKQDTDVLDTWFSSWLWPISVFNGIMDPDNEDIKYYYPTNDLITAPEILFFWVARMIIAGYEYENEKPFKNVYLTGIVRDKQGRKMSKSLGNSPDPIELIHQYGADGVRIGMLLTSPAGNDLPFDVSLCEQGRNFSNKIWNAMRLIKGWEIEEGENSVNLPALNWFEAKLQKTIIDTNKSYSNYYISEALKSLYSFVWDDFCSWLLEMIKPGYQQSIDRSTYHKVIGFFEEITRLLHPFMPFITEEIWHQINKREPGRDLIIDNYPKAGKSISTDLKNGEIIKEAVKAIRDLKNKNNIKPKEPIEVHIQTADATQYENILPLIQKLVFVSGYQFDIEEPDNAVTFICNKEKWSLIIKQELDIEAEKKRLLDEINYVKGFISSVERKLQNQNFVSNAPVQVVEKEKAKLEDGSNKLKNLEEAMSRLD